MNISAPQFTTRKINCTIAKERTFDIDAGTVVGRSRGFGGGVAGFFAAGTDIVGRIPTAGTQTSFMFVWIRWTIFVFFITEIKASKFRSKRIRRTILIILKTICFIARIVRRRSAINGSRIMIIRSGGFPPTNYGTGPRPTIRLS